jgi:hypothetical protein
MGFALSFRKMQAGAAFPTSGEQDGDLPVPDLSASCPETLNKGFPSPEPQQSRATLFELIEYGDVVGL